MMLHFVLSESIVSVLTQVLLHFLWQGALLGLLAACLLQVLPIHTASARYAFYCGLLTLLAICPLLTWSGIPVDPVAAIEVHASSAKEVGGGIAFTDADDSDMTSRTVPSNDGPSNLQPPDSWLQVVGAWLDRHSCWLVTAWLAGTCCMATRLLLGATGVWKLARRRQPIPPEVAHVVDRLAQQLAFRVRPAVHAVERISQAMAMGIFRPMVLLPASWISDLPSDVLEAVIAHELAHLRRWDLVVNLLQRVVETVLFFHPVVWWCSRRLRIEREMCCDELAHAAIGNRVVYAKALAYLAHQQGSFVESLLAAGIGGKKMVLLDRICNVLGMTTGQRGRLFGPSCALIGAALASLAWIAVVGLPAAWQSRVSNAGEDGIVLKSEVSRPSEAAQTTLPTAASEQSFPPDEVSPASELLTRGTRQFTSYRNLSLKEAIKTSTANVKAGPSECEHLTSPACTTCAQVRVRNLANDTESAYWELSFAWRNLETSMTALNSARQTWKRIHQRHIAGTEVGEAKEEAQAREQYYQFKSATQTLLNELFRAENRLCFVMGIAPADGRLTRPIDKPRVAKVNFDWRKSIEEALAHSPELRRQKWRVKRQELELLAAKNKLQPRLDSNGPYRWQGLVDNSQGQEAGTYRWQGLADESQGQEAGTSNADKPSSPTDASAAKPVDIGLFEEFALGAQMTLPVGVRKDLSTIRCYQQSLAREQAKLQEGELDVSQQLAEALRQLERTYQLTQTNFNRALAADRQVEALQAAFEAETVTLDQVLEAQRRQADAQTSYFRTLLDYQRAILAVHRHKGTQTDPDSLAFWVGPAR